MRKNLKESINRREKPRLLSKSGAWILESNCNREKKKEKKVGVEVELPKGYPTLSARFDFRPW